MYGSTDNGFVSQIFTNISSGMLFGFGVLLNGLVLKQLIIPNFDKLLIRVSLLSLKIST